MTNEDKVVITISELKKMIKNNEEDKIDEIDIVTAGTCGIMSGAMAVLHFEIGGHKKVKKFDKIYLNGIPGKIGPCPNEYLGKVDLTIYGTEYRGKYGGGFLFKDLIKGKEIEVVATFGNNTINKSITIEDIETCRLIGTRMAYKNYSAITNIGNEPIKTIFHRRSIKKGECSFSGCGEINPLQNMCILYENEIIGKRVLINGSEGIILGFGTRSTINMPNLMISGDMKKMDSYYIGGFITSDGVEVFNTVSIPIEVNDKHKEYLKTLDKDIDLPIRDILGREIIDVGKYSEVWGDVEYRPNINVYRCRNCDNCIPMSMCPTNAIIRVEHLGGRPLPTEDCFGCGVCGNSCPYGIYSIKLGSVKGIPITCRQSDRERAIKLCKDLKRRIEKGEFKI